AYLTVQLGTDLELSQAAAQLIAIGYQREQMVASPGEFSIRGGILDIYPLTEEHPVRIELFDTEVDSLRYFDPETQRSIKNIEELTIVPATDRIFPAELLQNAADDFSDRIQHQGALIKDEQEKDLLKKNMTFLLDAMKEGEPVEGLTPFAGLIYPKTTSVFDYLGEEAVVVVDEYARILAAERHAKVEEAEWLTEQLTKLQMLPEVSLYNDFRDEMKKV